MKRKPMPLRMALPADCVVHADFEWSDDPSPKALAAARASHKVQQALKAHWEQWRRKMLRFAERGLAQAKVELAYLAAEERMAAAQAKDREQTAKYIASLKAAMQKSLKKQHDEHQASIAPLKAKVKEIAKQIQGDTARLERHEFLKRGLVRGRRK